jgi:hypothetical protein
MKRSRSQRIIQMACPTAFSQEACGRSAWSRIRMRAGVVPEVGEASDSRIQRGGGLDRNAGRAPATRARR